MYNKTYTEYLKMIGRRIKLQRVYSGLSQQELADNTGISLKTISRLEQGNSIQLESFVRIIDALNLGENFSVLIPDQSIRPSMIKDDQKNIKQRVGKKIETMSKVTWGDDE